MLLRLVLDTTILIAAFRSTGGAAAQLLRKVLEGKFILLMDYRIASEYRDVALRPTHLAKSHLSAEEIEEVIVALEDLGTQVEIYWRHRPLSVDPSDDLVLDLAINGRANVIATRNLRRFSEPARSFGIDAVDAKTLLITMR